VQQLEDLYPPKLRKAVDALLHKPAVCSSELRQAIVTYAAQQSGGERKDQEIPPDLMTYVDKVTLYAYKITDHDIQQLIEAGYSEDAIFEITLCASLGASLARFERGLMALKGNQYAPSSA
jgi:hypothetical protein